MKVLILLLMLLPITAQCATLDCPGIATYVYAVGQGGRTVGQCIDADGVGHGFMHTDKAGYVIIDYPNSQWSALYGVSNGKVIGTFLDSSGHYHGYTYDRGMFTTLEYPGAVNTYATGIDSGGDVAGYYEGIDGKIHGFFIK